MATVPDGRRQGRALPRACRRHRGRRAALHRRAHDGRRRAHHPPRVRRRRRRRPGRAAREHGRRALPRGGAARPRDRAACSGARSSPAPRARRRPPSASPSGPRSTALEGGPGAAEAREALRPHTAAALARIDRAPRRPRVALRQRVAAGAEPLKYVIVATGNIYDDAVQAKAAAHAGADIVAVIRATAQSLLDYVPHGATTEGYGGTFATQENFRIIRRAPRRGDRARRPLRPCRRTTRRASAWRRSRGWPRSSGSTCCSTTRCTASSFATSTCAAPSSTSTCRGGSSRAPGSSSTPARTTT